MEENPSSGGECFGSFWRVWTDPFQEQFRKLCEPSRQIPELSSHYKALLTLLQPHLPPRWHPPHQGDSAASARFLPNPAGQKPFYYSLKSRVFHYTQGLANKSPVGEDTALNRGALLSHSCLGSVRAWPEQNEIFLHTQLQETEAIAPTAHLKQPPPNIRRLHFTC